MIYDQNNFPQAGNRVGTTQDMLNKRLINKKTAFTHHDFFEAQQLVNNPKYNKV